MDYKALLAIAKTHLKELATASTPDFRLEQAYKTEDGDWEIIVSFLVETPNLENYISPMSNLNGITRLYKKLQITEAGEVKGFYIFAE
jgi:hypothetical protein